MEPGAKGRGNRESAASVQRPAHVVVLVDHRRGAGSGSGPSRASRSAASCRVSRLDRQRRGTRSRATRSALMPAADRHHLRHLGEVPRARTRSVSASCSGCQKPAAVASTSRLDSGRVADDHGPGRAPWPPASAARPGSGRRTARRWRCGPARTPRRSPPARPRRARPAGTGSASAGRCRRPARPARPRRRASRAAGRCRRSRRSARGPRPAAGSRPAGDAASSRSQACATSSSAAGRVSGVEYRSTRPRVILQHVLDDHHLGLHRQRGQHQGDQLGDRPLAVDHRVQRRGPDHRAGQRVVRAAAGSIGTAAAESLVQPDLRVRQVAVVEQQQVGRLLARSARAPSVRPPSAPGPGRPRAAGGAPPCRPAPRS